MLATIASTETYKDLDELAQKLATKKQIGIDGVKIT